MGRDTNSDLEGTVSIAMRKNETQSFKTEENDSLDSHQNVAMKSETKPLIGIFDLVSLISRRSLFWSRC